MRGFFGKLDRVAIAVGAGNILCMAGDMTMTWSSPVIPKLLSNETETNPLGRPIDDEEISWVGSLVIIGAILGSIPSGVAADYFGRKNTLLFLGVPHVVSLITLAFAESIGLYYFARILCGAAVGAAYSIMPMYIGEVAEDSNRGMLLSTMNISIGVGNLLPYAIGPHTSLLVFNLVLVVLPVAFMVSFYLAAPETPYYFMIRGDVASVERSLVRLRSKSERDVGEELLKIKASVEEEHRSNWKDAFKTKAGRTAVYISVVLIVLQQLSGINAIIFYTELIFTESGNVISPDTAALILGVVQVLSSFVTPLAVDKYGRRPLYIISNIGMTVSLALLGAYYYLQEETDYDVKQIFWLPVTSLVGYIIAFKIGAGPLPWCISGEIFASNMKAAGMALTTLACWISGFFTAKYFLSLSDKIGNSGCFWIFAGVCLLATFFVFYQVPETKGKSFAEIQEILGRCKE